MAGHSHWAGIKHKKDRTDKIRSKIFSKISREITVAAKLGDKDPETNPRLRSAILSARSANMPKENINRAIEKSQSSIDGNYDEIKYEGFLTHNIACIVETLTDNKNRTASNIRTIFQKSGGSLGTTGSASHNFIQKGIIRFESRNKSENEIYNYIVDLGVHECFISNNFYEIHCDKNEIFDIKTKIEVKTKLNLQSNLEWVPLNFIELNDEKKKEILKFVETLEDDDDVQKVYTNLKN